MRLASMTARVMGSSFVLKQFFFGIVRSTALTTLEKVRLFDSLLPARLVARRLLLPEPALLVPHNRVFGKFSKGRENLFSEGEVAIFVFVGELTPEFSAISKTRVSW
jgi:hypothetical protein